MRCCYILKENFQRSILPDRCFSPFYLNFYEYEMLIEREVCLFSLLFKITVNSLLWISVISFSQLKNYVIIKFAMGCIQLNEKLVARLKIGLTAKQFETKAVGFCEHTALAVVVKFVIKFFTARESNDRQTYEWMNSMKLKVGLLAKHWTYQTLDKWINAAVVMPI